MSTDHADGAYTYGEPHPQTQSYATHYTKPASDGYTGGGYELWRSVERRPETPTRGKEDVYVAVHRLTAVAACYPDDMPLPDVLDDLREKDVHHESGVPWDNRPSNLSVVTHGRHSEITNTKRRAWAEDAKRDAEETPPDPDADECDGCGEATTDALARSDEWDGEWCIECVQAHRERQQALDELEELDL